MRTLLYIFSVILTACLSTPVFAGQMSFKLQETKSGSTQFRLLGKNLCDRGDAKSFKMNKGTVSGQGFIKSGPYVSNSKKSEWKVNKKDNCSINQQVSNDLLEPGKALEVTTYDDFGYAVERFYVLVPCQEELSLINTEHIFYTETDLISATVCETGSNDAVVVKDVEIEDQYIIDHSPDIIIAPTPDEPEAVQNCSVSVEVDRDNASLVNVLAGCDYTDELEVQVVSGSQILAEGTVNITYSRFAKQNIFSYSRDSNINSVVEVRTYSREFQKKFKNVSKTLYKEPTFLFRVGATIQSPMISNVPAEAKAFGRGKYYSSEISIQVEDRDIDANYPQREITVELIKTTNGQLTVIQKNVVSTNDIVKFQVEGQYVTPLMFGSDSWDEDGDLQQGENTFKIRIYDAYQSANYIESDTVRLNVR